MFEVFWFLYICHFLLLKNPLSLAICAKRWLPCDLFSMPAKSPSASLMMVSVIGFCMSLVVWFSGTLTIHSRLTMRLRIIFFKFQFISDLELTLKHTYRVEEVKVLSLFLWNFIYLFTCPEEYSHPKTEIVTIPFILNIYHIPIMWDF